MTVLPEIGVRLTVDVDGSWSGRRAAIGQGIRARAEFYNRRDGAPAEVTDPVITVQPPVGSNGALPAPLAFGAAQLVADGTGAWYLDFPGERAGAWRVRASCTAPLPAAAEGSVTIQASNVVPPSAASPMLVTTDLRPLFTLNGGVLTAQRVSGLPGSGTLNGTEALLTVRGDDALLATTEDLAALAIDGYVTRPLADADGAILTDADGTLLIATTEIARTPEELDVAVVRAEGARAGARGWAGVAQRNSAAAGASAQGAATSLQTSQTASQAALAAAGTITQKAAEVAEDAAAVEAGREEVETNAEIVDQARADALAYRDAAIAAASAAAGAGGAPADALVATAAPYGVVVDGQRGTLLASWSLSGDTLTATGYAGTYSLTSGSRLLRKTIATPGQGWAFQAADAGKPIHVPGAVFSNGTAVSRIRRVLTPMLVELEHAAETGVSGAITCTWPCFRALDQGKSIWVDQATVMRNVTLAPIRPSSIGPLLTTIAQVLGPTQIRIAATTKTAQTTPTPTEIVWGTDNTGALITAAGDAMDQGKTVMLFKAQFSGLLCAFGLFLPWAGRPVRAPELGYLVGAMTWVGENVEGFITDTAGLVWDYKPIIPRGAGPPHPPERTLTPAQMQALIDYPGEVIPVVVAGDSMARDIITGMAPPVQGPPHFVIEMLRKMVPGKQFHVVNRGIGGYTWKDINGTLTANQGWGVIGDVYLDKVLSIPDRDGNPVAPAVVVMFNSGANDNFSLSARHMAAGLRKIDALDPKPAVIMNCARGGPFAQEVSDVAGYEDAARAPYWLRPLQGREYASTLHRTWAAREGRGFLDYQTRAMEVQSGWAPRKMMPVAKPFLASVTLNPAGVRFPYLCRGFSFTIEPPSGNGTTFWTALGRLGIQLSAQPDNVLLLEPDAATGRLTAEVRTWGFEVVTPVTMTAGQKGITVGAPTVASADWTLRTRADEDGMLQRVDMTGSFSGLTFGTPILFPAADGGADLRTMVADAGTNIAYRVADFLMFNATGSSFSYGAPMFQALDADARVDLIIDLPGGGRFQTRIAGITSQTEAEMEDAAPVTLTGASCRLFLGRVCFRRTSLNRVVTPDTGIAPEIWISLHDGKLMLAHAPGSNNQPQVILQADIERFGGPFRPYLSASGSATAKIHRIAIPQPVFVMPTITSDRMWGLSGVDGEFNYGDGGSHLTTEHAVVVDSVVCGAQG